MPPVLEFGPSLKMKSLLSPTISTRAIAVVLAAMFGSSAVCIAEITANDSFSHFIGAKRFGNWKKATGSNPNETVFTSPEFNPPIAWNQLVASWNADAPPGTFLKIEARAFSGDHWTKYYGMGLWSEDPKQFPRESVKGQKDADGNVDTDTLILNQAGSKAQVRITLGSATKNSEPELKFVGLSFCNTQIQPTPQSPLRAAWGKETPIIERSQNAYPDEQGWCSPTSISMVLTHWSEKLNRKDMAVDVPDVVPAIHDKAWGGTGNWPFNTAYCGHFKGMRAYVTRFSDISEIEEWTVRGFPVVMSAPWQLLKPGRKSASSGHIVVCTGFTETGDVVINDPGTNPDPKIDRVRHVYKRADVINAWSKNHNTVYLIYPESAKIPKDTRGHWERK